MSEQQTLVVIGASHAGSQLAIQARRSGWSGRIVLIGAEDALPYHRPPLSKAVMAGEKSRDDILLRPAALYENNAVELWTGRSVVSIDRSRQRVTLDDGEALVYDRLALCTGARVVRLPLGDGLAGVHYLRFIADVEAIRADVAPGRRAVIIGAGYIGLEAAAALSGQGLDVTVLEREDRVLQRVVGKRMSQYVAALHQHHGVKIHCNMDVTAINGADHVESVACADGSHFDADLVVIGVGIVPETTLAERAGLRIDNGIRVDEFARTSDPAIVAAGDCTSYHSALYGRTVRLESVQNANDQSRVAAATVCGREQPYTAVPWFWSDQFGIKLQAAGLSDRHDETVLLGEADPASAEGFSLLYFRNGVLIAADSVNQAKVFMACKKLVGEQAGREHVIEQLGSD